MDRRHILLIGFVACLLALTTVLASSTAPSASISVGDFAVLVASKMNPGDTQGPLTPAAAADVLRKHGMKVSSDLTSPLTEKEAASLFGQLGIALQTEHPEALLNPERAASLVGIFGGNLAATGARTDATLASKTASTTPGAPTLETIPLDCQSLPRPPSPCVGPQSVCNPCMDCCKNLLGLSGKDCGPLCQKRNLVVCPDEPTP